MCIPFDSAKVDSFDVNNVPTLSNVINDIGTQRVSPAGVPQCLEESTSVFKQFLKKLQVNNMEEFRQLKQSNGKIGADQTFRAIFDGVLRMCILI